MKKNYNYNYAGGGQVLSGIGGVMGAIPTPVTQIAGAIFSGVGAIATAGQERKELETQRVDQVDNMMKYANMSVANPYANTFANGGMVPYAEPNIEAEGGEVAQGPDGSMASIQGASHGQGGVDLAAQPGTRIYSDKLKASTGKTFAEEADIIRKQMAKYERLLS